MWNIIDLTIFENLFASRYSSPITNNLIGSDQSVIFTNARGRYHE